MKSKWEFKKERGVEWPLLVESKSKEISQDPLFIQQKFTE